MTTASCGARPHALMGCGDCASGLVGENLEDVAVVLLQGAGAGLGLGLLAGQPAAPRGRTAGAVADRAGQSRPTPTVGLPSRRVSMTVHATAESARVVHRAGDQRNR